jgi:uncharacterized protein (TIGR04255 family)
VLTLPQPDRRPLANAALPQVVTQIRFNEDTVAVPADELAAVQAALAAAGMPHPRLSQVTANEVIVVQGPGQMTAETPQRRGWRLDTTDGDWQLTLMPGSVALETPRFPGFGVLAERIAVVLAAVGEVAHPAVVTRVGLRFVNLLPSLSADAGLRGWPSWVAPELTGLLAHTELGDGVAGTEQRTIVTINEQMSATVHAGLVAQPEGHRFLLDIDSYSEPAASWSIELVSGLLADLNDASVSLFQMLLSPEMLSYLRVDVGTGEGDR